MSQELVLEVEYNGSFSCNGCQLDPGDFILEGKWLLKGKWVGKYRGCTGKFSSRRAMVELNYPNVEELINNGGDTPCGLAELINL